MCRLVKEKRLNPRERREKISGSHSNLICVCALSPESNKRKKCNVLDVKPVQHKGQKRKLLLTEDGNVYKVKRSNCETVTTFITTFITTYVLTFATRLNKQITTTCGELTISYLTYHLKAFNLNHVFYVQFSLNSDEMLLMQLNSDCVGNKHSSKPHQILYHFLTL